MTALTAQQIGRRFEADLQANFRTAQKLFGFAWHRFVDSKEAGNVVRTQPSDFLVTTSRGLALVEAKASTTVDHFVPSLLRPSQRQAIRHYGQMLNMPCFVLFRSDLDKRVDLLDGKLCLSATRSKRVPAIASTRAKDFSKFLAEAWGLEPIAGVVRNFNLRYGEAANDG